jgi:hypothetical protein
MVFELAATAIDPGVEPGLGISSTRSQSRVNNKPSPWNSALQ